MSLYLFWFLLISGILRLIFGVYGATQHGKPARNYNGGVQAIDAIIGFLMILFAYEVI